MQIAYYFSETEKIVFCFGVLSGRIALWTYQEVEEIKRIIVCFALFRTKFYAVQIVLALEHLHQKNFIYREQALAHTVSNLKMSLSIKRDSSDLLILVSVAELISFHRPIQQLELLSIYLQKSLRKVLTSVQLQIGGLQAILSSK